jgi:capsular polysaccharide biosynthesis protein
MDLGEILRVMRRRWYLMAPVMVLTIAATALAYLFLPTSYESTATVSLLTAKRASILNKEGNTNPYLTFDASLVATADFLSRSLSSKGAQEELKGLGVTEEYTVALADNAQGPFISIVVTGDDEAQVLSSTGTLTEFAARKLTEIQKASGVDADDMVRLTTIIPPQKPEELVKDKLQLVIAVAGAGTALAFMLTFITEGLARSRRTAAGPSVSSVRSVVATNSAPAARSDSSRAVDLDKTAAIILPPAQRSPLVPPKHIPGEVTELIIGRAGQTPAAASARPASTAKPAPSAKPAASASPAKQRTGGGAPSTTVYRSNVTNGKSHDDGEKPRSNGG